MSEDAVSDADWDDLLAGFRRQFWAQRVPAFAAVWQDCQEQPAVGWGAALKQAIHGLAGVAALVGLPEVGDSARRIELIWDEQGAASEALRGDIADLLAQLQAAR